MTRPILRRPAPTTSLGEGPGTSRSNKQAACYGGRLDDEVQWARRVASGGHHPRTVTHREREIRPHARRNSPRPSGPHAASATRPAAASSLMPYYWRAHRRGGGRLLRAGSTSDSGVFETRRPVNQLPCHALEKNVVNRCTRILKANNALGWLLQSGFQLLVLASIPLGETWPQGAPG